MPSGRGCALRDGVAGSPRASALKSGARTETVRSIDLTVSPRRRRGSSPTPQATFLAARGVNPPEKATGWQRVKTSGAPRTMLHCARHHETALAKAPSASPLADGASPKFHDPVSQCEHTQTSRIPPSNPCVNYTTRDSLAHSMRRTAPACSRQHGASNY